MVADVRGSPERFPELAERGVGVGDIAVPPVIDPRPRPRIAGLLTALAELGTYGIRGLMQARFLPVREIGEPLEVIFRQAVPRLRVYRRFIEAEEISRVEQRATFRPVAVSVDAVPIGR
jgi:hypothetical protein